MTTLTEICTKTLSVIPNPSVTHNVKACEQGHSGGGHESEVIGNSSHERNRVRGTVIIISTVVTHLVRIGFI